MRTMLLPVAIAVAMLLSLGFGGSAAAFHDGGVGHCDGCHTMHNSADGIPLNPNGTVGTGVSTWLTTGSDPSSTCLNCHQGSGAYRIFSTDGSSFTAGGDFYWLTKTFVWTERGENFESAGDDHGHNVIATDFGLMADATMQSTTAPGGTFPIASLGCNSCHDPHGQIDGGTKGGAGAVTGSGSYGADPTAAVVGNYRLLGDTGYDGGERGGQNFANSAPIATAPTLFSGPVTDSNHVAYGEGMSEWCANCHTGFTSDSSFHMKHPASNDGQLGRTYSNNYNSYVRTGDFTGTPSTAYWELVPFEEGVADPTALDPTSRTGPTSSANVMCLTCHRAHASAFQNIGRWDHQADFIANSHPQASDGGVTGNDVLNSYYGRDMLAEFGQYQRSLCNKCHVQD